MNGIIRKCNKDIVTTSYAYYAKTIECGRSFTIVQVSDLQSEYFGTGQRGLLEAVKGCDPDLIVFTGDLVDRGHTDYLAAEKAIHVLQSVAPVYYVNGNHEADLFSAEAADLYQVLKRDGVHVLLDRGEIAEFNGVRVNIAGLSEYTIFQARGQQAGTGHRTKKQTLAVSPVVRQIRRAFGDRDAAHRSQEGSIRILLAHEPQYLRWYSAAKPDLIFSGHAHGGQFCLPGRRGLSAPDQGVFPKLTWGRHRCGDTTMFISRGLGNSSFPLRLNNPPEIVRVQVIGTAEEERAVQGQSSDAQAE